LEAMIIFMRTSFQMTKQPHTCNDALTLGTIHNGLVLFG
jgi:hypothetical protein